MEYLEFKMLNQNTKIKINCFYKIITRLVYFFKLSANPDYDEKINEVEYWVLEFENKNEFPIREIGLDKNKNIILKMPYKNNYGYWTDNNMRYEDFLSSFKCKIVSEDYFNKKWS